MPQPAPPQQVKLDAAIAGPLFMLAAALLFTLLNLIVKQIGPAYTIWHIGFYRFFGGVVVLLLLFGRHGNAYRGHNTRLLIIRGFTGSAAFLSIVTAIRLLPVSTALVIFYSFPAFAAVFAYLIYGERISRAEIGCIAMVIVGIAVLFDFSLEGNLFGPGHGPDRQRLCRSHGDHDQNPAKKNGPVIIYLYFCTMGLLVTLPQFAMSPLIPATAMDWAMVLGIVLTSVTAQLLMNQGFFLLPGMGGRGVHVQRSDFHRRGGIAFLGDPSSWRFWSGGLLIVGSAVALNRFKANHARRENA